MYTRNGTVGNQFFVRGFPKFPLGGSGGSGHLYVTEQEG